MPPPPTNHTIFDPWNSASTGHQRAENPYSNTTAWRQTRAAKLAIQFASASGDCTAPSPNGISTGGEGGGGGEWKWLSEAEARRHQLGCRDIRTMMGMSKPTKRSRADGDDDAGKKGKILCQTQTQTRETKIYTQPETETKTKTDPTPTPTPENEDDGRKKKILAGTIIYINGSTMPHISDHRLKSLLVAHGAEVAISLARGSVTHVIVGKPNAGPGAGAGGGLAAGKLQNEIARAGCRGVKVVGVEWYSLLLSPLHFDTGVGAGAGANEWCVGRWRASRRRRGFRRRGLRWIWRPVGRGVFWGCFDGVIHDPFYGLDI